MLISLHSYTLNCVDNYIAKFYSVALFSSFICIGVNSSTTHTFKLIFLQDMFTYDNVKYPCVAVHKHTYVTTMKD